MSDDDEHSESVTFPLWALWDLVCLGVAVAGSSVALVRTAEAVSANALAAALNEAAPISPGEAAAACGISSGAGSSAGSRVGGDRVLSEWASVTGVASAAEPLRLPGLPGPAAAVLETTDVLYAPGAGQSAPAHFVRLQSAPSWSLHGGGTAVAVDGDALARAVAAAPGAAAQALADGGAVATRGAASPLSSLLGLDGSAPLLLRRLSYVPLAAAPVTVLGRLALRDGALELTAHPLLGMLLLGGGGSGLTAALAAAREHRTRAAFAAAAAAGLAAAALLAVFAPGMLSRIASRPAAIWRALRGPAASVDGAVSVGSTSAAALNSGTDSPASADGATACVACFERAYAVATMPCMHVCLCLRCAERICHAAHPQERRCPLCRATIEGVLRVFPNGGGNSGGGSGGAAERTQRND